MSKSAEIAQRNTQPVNIVKRYAAVKVSGYLSFLYFDLVAGDCRAWV
jgi:hypothetical protein